MTTGAAAAVRHDGLVRWLRRSTGIMDAGVSSLGNLATNVIAARSLALGEFGTFATTMLIGIILVGVSRSMYGDPLTLMHSADEPAEQRRAFARVIGAALLGALCVAPVLVAVTTGVVVAGGGGLPTGLRSGLALTAAAPLLVGQELLRAVSYASGRPQAALFNSLTWTLLLVPGLFLLHVRTAPALVLLWGLTAGGGLVVGLVLNRLRPVLMSPLAWFRESRHISRKLLVDFGLTQITAEFSVVLISMLAGAAQAGLIRKAQIPLTPVIVVGNGIIAMAQPALVRRVASGRRMSVRPMAYQLGGFAAGCSIVLGILVSLLPTVVMREVVGSNWPEARRLVPVLAVYLGLGALGGCQGIALRALGRIGDQVRLRLVLTPVSLALVFLSARGGAAWAVVGLALSLAGVTLGCAWLLNKPITPPRAMEESA